MRPKWRSVRGKWILKGANFLVYGSKDSGWLVLWRKPGFSDGRLIREFDESCFMGYFEDRGDARRMFDDLESRTVENTPEITLVGVHRPTGKALDRLKQNFRLEDDDVEALVQQASVTRFGEGPDDGKYGKYVIRYPQESPLVPVTHEMGHLENPAQRGSKVLTSEKKAIQWQIGALKGLGKYSPRRRKEVVNALWGHLEHIKRVKRGEDGPYADESPGGATLKQADRIVSGLERSSGRQRVSSSKMKVLQTLQDRSGGRKPVIVDYEGG